MALLDITVYPDPILKQHASPVDDVDDSIRRLLDDMAETMYASSGVGLAAPQVGKSMQAIVVDASPMVEGEHLLKLVNPVLSFAEGCSTYEEACLSLPGVSEMVSRADNIVVEAYNEHGSQVRIETATFLATVLQHEIDHLNGMLFVDHLSRLKRSIITRKLRKAADRMKRTRRKTQNMS